MEQELDAKTEHKKRRQRQRDNRRYGSKQYQDIVGGTNKEFYEKYGKGKPKIEIIKIWLSLSPEERLKYSGGMDKRTIAGVNDFTPYNAITGDDAMSAGRVSDPKQKLPGGFNTAKG